MDPAALDAAWADLAARWDDEAAHRALIDRFGDLEALAEVGRRYKEALDARPGDAMALRGRDEVLKRATALALAQLPRTAPPRETPRGLELAVVFLAGAGGIAAAAWVLFRLAAPGGIASP
jgi:hypothetical protein